MLKCLLSNSGVPLTATGIRVSHTVMTHCRWRIKRRHFV